MAGYSGKPLFEKLGLKPNAKSAAINAPKHYAALMDGAKAPGAFKAGPYDFIHVFVADNAALEKHLPRALKALGDGGMIWVSWPKKSSALFKDLTEDGIRKLALPMGIVDVKVCAVDEDWSGLKFLRRKKAQ